MIEDILQVLTSHDALISCGLLGAVAPTRTIRVRFRSDWLLHHGYNRGRHSANHNLLPDMHLSVPVLRVKTCHDSWLV